MIFQCLNSVDPEGLIKDLISLQKRQTNNNDDTRYIYFDIFSDVNANYSENFNIC